MAAEHILGPDDPRVAPYREISDAELLRAHGVFVAEGRLVVRRVIEDGRFRVRSVLVNDAARRDLAPVFERLPADVPILGCDADDFISITGFDIHRGCLALVERPADPGIDRILEAGRLIVMLEGVGNADNVGGVFRNVAALGADGVLLSPTCCDPFYRKAVRTSMGAVLRVPFARAPEWPAALMRVRTAGFTLVALTPREPSESIATFASRARPGNVALIAGAEGSGLSAAVEATADARVKIPIDPGVDSLNVAVAVGIALYALRQESTEKYETQRHKDTEI